MRCKNLKSINLLTSLEDGNNQQVSGLNGIKASLAARNIQLTITYSSSLHDREIHLSNGWIIKIGRGLDYFKRSEKFTLGFHEMSLRKCYETTVDVFHRRFVKLS